MHCNQSGPELQSENGASSLSGANEFSPLHHDSLALGAAASSARTILDNDTTVIGTGAFGTISSLRQENLAPGSQR